VHESIIGSQFTGRIEGRTRVGGLAAIVPSIEGWARVTGFNTLFVDDRDPYWRGFQLGAEPKPASAPIGAQGR
jgi:4-hydroxyproline epimerase